MNWTGDARLKGTLAEAGGHQAFDGYTGAVLVDRCRFGLRIRKPFHVFGLDVHYSQLIAARQQREYLVLEFWDAEMYLPFRVLIASSAPAVDRLVRRIEREARDHINHVRTQSGASSTAQTASDGAVSAASAKATDTAGRPLPSPMRRTTWLLMIAGGFVATLFLIGVTGMVVVSLANRGIQHKGTAQEGSSSKEAPGSEPVEAQALSELATPTGTIRVGDTWDAALLHLKSTRRVALLRDGAGNQFTDTRVIEGRRYAFVFERPAAPRTDGYRITRIEPRPETAEAPPLPPRPQSAPVLDADAILAEEKEASQQLAARAVELVEDDKMYSAIALYRARRSYLVDLRGRIRRGSLTSLEKTRVIDVLTFEIESVDRVLADFD